MKLFSLDTEITARSLRRGPSLPMRLLLRQMKRIAAQVADESPKAFAFPKEVLEWGGSGLRTVEQHAVAVLPNDVKLLLNFSRRCAANREEHVFGLSVVTTVLALVGTPAKLASRVVAEAARLYTVISLQEARRT